MSARTSPDTSHPLAPERAETSMSPAQARRLEELRADHPTWTYTPTYVHGISGMVEVRFSRPGGAARSMGLTASGGEVSYALSSAA